MKEWLTLFLLSLLFTGCNNSAQSTRSEVIDPAQKIISGGTTVSDSLSYDIIKSGQYPVDTKGTQERLVFHSDDTQEVEAFNKRFLELTNEMAPAFEGTMIIATMGEKNNGGYSIDVESIKDSGRYVEITILSKSPNSKVTMALTNPYIVLSLPNSHKDIHFIENDE